MRANLCTFAERKRERERERETERDFRLTNELWFTSNARHEINNNFANLS